MRAIACITLLIWGVISTKNASGSFCSSGSLSPHTGFCYHVHPEKNAKVKDSRKICRDTYGGDIPSIFSDDENTFIKNLLEPESHDNYWIGVNDRLVEDDFRDVMRNERLDYSNWKANEPDNAYYADCAAMERSSGEWIDYTCSTLSFFAVGIICQQPPNPNPYTLCPANMLNYVASSGTECYWFSMDKLTALQAESHCASMGSKLAFIEDQDLDLFLYSYQQSAEMDTLWIGTQQLLDSSGQSYRSVEFGTTTPVYYDNFMSTYSGSENLICAAKIRSEGGKWNQLNCDDGTYHFVCRFTNGTETNTSPETTVATTTTTTTTTATTTTTIPSTTPANTTIHTTTEATTPSSTTNPTTTTPTTTESTTAVQTTTQATTTHTTTEPTTPKPTTTEEDTTTLPSTTATTTHSPTTTAVTTTTPTTYASTTQPFTTDRGTTTTATTTQATASETTATSIAISTEATDALARSPEAVAFKSLSTGYSIADRVF